MKVFCYLFSSLTLISVAHATNLVFNPSFEETDASGAATHWSEGTFRNSMALDGLVPHDGSRMEITDCANTSCINLILSQHLATTNDTYTLTFWLDLGDTTDDGSAEVTVLWSVQGFPSFEVVGDFFAQNEDEAGPQLVTITGLPGDAVHGRTVAFTGFNDTSFVSIDNVCVTSDGNCDSPSPSATTPEPASMSLLGGGFLAIAGLAAMRRRWARAGYRSR